MHAGARADDEDESRWGGRCRCALDVYTDEHAGTMTMHMTSDGAFLRREGSESEPATAYRAPKVLWGRV